MAHLVIMFEDETDSPAVEKQPFQACLIFLYWVECWEQRFEKEP